MRAFKKIMCAVMAIATLMIGMSFPVSANSLTDYKLLEDNGMFEEYKGDGYRVYLSPNNTIEYFYYDNSTFVYDVYNDISEEEIIDVISRNFPRNPLNSGLIEGVELYTDISKFAVGDKIRYIIEDDREYEEIKKSEQRLMVDLEYYKYISAFYDNQEVGTMQKISGFEEITYYAEHYDKIKQYLEENNLNCTLEFTEANDTFVLAFEEEKTAEENFNIAADIYKELNIKPNYSIEEETSDMFFGSNTRDEIEHLQEPKELINQFIEEKNYIGNARIELNGLDSEGNYNYIIWVYVYPWVVEKIEAFVSENGIDESQIVYFTPDIWQVIIDKGDANHDGQVNVRDAAFIASALANNTADELPESADYNEDEKINVRDAAAIAQYLAEI